MRFRALALLVASFLLAVPAAAFAQSAGDEQYSDPFAKQQPPSSSPDSSGDGGSGDDQLVQTPAPSSSNGNGPTGGDSGSSPTSSASSDGSALPRTGLRAWMLAVMGGTMLLFGALLRLGARPRRLR
jgi:hypothetical protein